MRVFIDTNVLIDVVDPRRSDHEASYSVLRMAGDGRIDIVLTGLTVINTIYAVRKNGVPKKHLLAAVRAILNSVEIASTDMPQLISAIDSGWDDVEDAVQFYAAVNSGHIDAIVTGNARDFKRQRVVPVMTPKEFIEHYAA